MKSKAEENMRDSDAIIVEKEKKVKEQSALIQKQKTLIFEAREEIQQNGRTIDGLRVDVSSGDSAISELKSKLNNVGDMVELEAVHAELEETKQLVKTLQQDRDSVSGTQSVSSWTANSDPRSESAVQRAKRAFDVSIPTGTVKARVAMAASRFKNKTTVNQQTSYVKAKEGQDSTVKRSLATFNGSAIPSDMSGSWKPMTHNNRGVSEEEHQKVLTHLSEKTTIVEKLQLEMQIEIRKMVAEKTECEKQLHDMKGAYKVEIDNMRDGNSSFIQCLKVSHEKEIKVLLVEKSNLEQRLIDLENANSKDQSSTLSKIESERSSTTTSGKITKEDEHKFADLEDGYKAEIEGIISEKKELKQRLVQTVEAHKVELRRLVEEKILCEHSAEELKETHNEEIRRLSAEKQYFEQHISSLEQNLKDAEERYAQEAQESMSRIGNIVDAVTHEVGETTCEAEATAAPTTNPSSREVESVRKENQQLGNRVNALENEIETVGGLLEETIMSIKEKDDEIEALRDNVNATTNAGLLSRFGGQGGRVTEQKKITNLSQYTDDEIKQLERICKLHQLTIIRQRSQAKAMLKQLGEAKADKEKIAILEAQFAEVNKVLESKQMNSAVSADSGPDTMQASIIKVDAAFISSLEQKSEKDQGRVEELQHEVRILKDRIETMKEKMNVEIVLRAQVDDLTMALEARELEIKSLEEAYSSRRSIVTQASLQMSSSMKSFGDVDSEFEELTSDELRDIVSKRDKMIKKLKAKVAGLEQSLKTAGPRGAVINLRKVSLLQEMQDAIVRRLNVLINRMDDNRETEDDLDQEFMSPSKSFLISMSDKLSLLHDYQKISLHLLESKLTNEIESLRSGGKPVELNSDVEARFERILETLRKTEEDVGKNNQDFSAELERHNIKLSAKNGVIESLLTRDNKRKSTIKTLQNELDIFKGLSEYQNINMGVMSRFKECAKLEQELEEKDMVVRRLNDIIEDYRYENQ
eukprot:scaffold338_cov231-Chaetoceros_neogracile.AAC.21